MGGRCFACGLARSPRAARSPRDARNTPGHIGPGIGSMAIQRSPHRGGRLRIVPQAAQVADPAAFSPVCDTYRRLSALRPAG